MLGVGILVMAGGFYGVSEWLVLKKFVAQPRPATSCQEYPAALVLSGYMRGWHPNWAFKPLKPGECTLSPVIGK
jgi:hypothetical protein